MTGPRRNQRAILFQRILSFLIACSVILLSFYYQDPLFRAMSRVRVPWAAAGLMFYWINYCLRAFRLRLVCARRFPFWPDAVYASSLHGFMTYLMPLQTGDVTLPMILKSMSNTSLLEGGMIWIRIRLLDMAALGALMMVAAMTTDISLAYPFRLIWLASGVVLAAAPFLASRLMTSGSFYSLRMSRFFKPFAKADRITMPHFFMSFGIWISVAVVFYCVVQALDLPIGMGGACFLVSVQLPLQLAPVQGFANTGNHEGGWIAALSLLGIPVSQAVEFAVTSHVLILSYVLILGIIPAVIRPSKPMS